jgi:hypothetical protein
MAVLIRMPSKDFVKEIAGQDKSLELGTTVL